MNLIDVNFAYFFMKLNHGIYGNDALRLKESVGPNYDLIVNVGQCDQ